MTTNRLAKSEGGVKGPKQCPPDMPRGDSEADKLARERYWVDRGNQLLAEAGKRHLEWRAKNGFYWLEHRP